MALAGYKVTLVGVTILNGLDDVAMRHVVKPFTFKFPVAAFECEGSLTLLLTHDISTYIYITFGICHRSIAIGLPIREVASVGCPTFHGQRAFSISLVVVEIAFIDITVCGHKFSLELSLAILKISFIDGAVRELHFSKAVLEAIIVHALEDNSVLLGLFTSSMGGAIFKLSLVPCSRRIDNFTLASFPALVECASVFNSCHTFLHALTVW